MYVKSPWVINIGSTKAAISRIRALDLRLTTIEKIKELLFDVFYGHVVATPRFHPGVKLFRLVICDKPSHRSELLYPPPHKTPLGRVNRRGSPVLYCCASRNSTLFETRPTKGQTVVIFQWVTTGPMMVNNVGYNKPTFEALGTKRQHAGWDNEPIDDENRFILDFLSEAFTRRVVVGSEHEYILTIAIAEKLFSQDLFDGLLYPAIAVSANADNFALKTYYVDKNLHFLKAEYARVEDVKDNFFEINILDTATKLEADGRIIWKGRRDQWIVRPGEPLKFSAENGEWVARDASGKIIEPD